MAIQGQSQACRRFFGVSKAQVDLTLPNAKDAIASVAG
jgi:hypothetical protein